MLYYVGTDHLGGTIRVTDNGFTAVDAIRYRPFGASRDAGTSLQTDHKFTSQIEDQVIGLYWYNSRADDPVIGRFVAPDTIMPEPKNPRSLNRYTYGLNNPLRYTDPSGHDEADWFDDSRQEEFRLAHGKDPDITANSIAVQGSRCCAACPGWGGLDSRKTRSAHRRAGARGLIRWIAPVW